MAVWQHPVVGMLCFGLDAAAVSMFNVQIMSVRQALIPEELFGRVQGAYRTVIWGGIPIGTLVGGVLGGWLGLTAVFVVSGVVGVVVGVLTWQVLRRHRHEIAAGFERGRTADTVSRVGHDTDGARLLDGADWAGNIFVEGSGAQARRATPRSSSRPPATSWPDRPGRRDDVAAAAARQPMRSGTGRRSRTPRVRRCCARPVTCSTEHADEISWWNVREVGAIPRHGRLRTARSRARSATRPRRCPARPYGELIPSEEPRLSLAQRVPVGVVARDLPVQRADHPEHPVGRTGPGARQRRDPQAGPADRRSRAASASLASSRRRACPPAFCSCSRVVPTSARRSWRTRTCASSRSPGRRQPVAASASWPARHLKRAHLELGGNSAMVVLDDADVDQAVNLAAWGSFFHQGQICMTTGRHIVHERLYDDFVERAGRARRHTSRSATRRPSEVALGPVIDAGQRDKIHDLVTASPTPGRRSSPAATTTRLFYPATVLAEVTAASTRLRRGDLRPRGAGRRGSPRSTTR